MVVDGDCLAQAACSGVRDWSAPTARDAVRNSWKACRALRNGEFSITLAKQ